MKQEIFVPHSQIERENIIALAEYLGSIFYG